MTEPAPGAHDRDDEGSQFVQHMLQIALFVAVFGGFVLFMLFLWSEWQNPDWAKVMRHFPAAVGLPAAAVGAFIVCTLFRSAEGKIKFGVAGFKFEGASGPIVMWVLCFLAISFAVRLVWELTL